MRSRAGSRRLALQRIGSAAVVVLLLASCGFDSRPRTRADESVLIEITSATTARITVQANETSFLSRPVTPRGGPPTVTADTRQPTELEKEEGFKAFLAELEREPTTGISHPRVTIAAVGDLIADDSAVTHLEVLSKRITATVRFDHVDPVLRFAPAAVVRALDRGGVDPAKSIWVGVCVDPTRGRWTSASDVFNRARGCAGWVPDRRASSVGALHFSSAFPTEAWMVALLGVGALGLLVVCVIRARVRPLRRISRLWLAPLAILVTSVAIGIYLLGTSIAIGDIEDVFGSTIEDPTRQLANRGATAALIIAIAACFTTLWTLSQPENIDR